MQVAIDSLPAAFSACPHFKLLAELCSPKPAFLVGGAIRDALIGRTLTDLDLVFPQDPTALARDFARRIGGHWFWLDRTRQQSRVVVHHADHCPNYDFALYRAPTLEQDLFDRDFTINALALPLANTLAPVAMIDPCHGFEDLRRGVLRMVHKDSFGNDPLRIIKGVRHATALGLEIEAVTLRQMRAAVAGLAQVAPERIRHEVWKILADRQAGRGLQLLVTSGAGEQLFGPGFTGALDAWPDELTACRRRWQGFAAKHAMVADWLKKEIEQGLNYETLLLFTFLLTSVEEGLPVHLAESWKLSRKTRAGIKAVTALDASRVADFMKIARNQRAYAWWSARHGIDPKLLLLALAGSQATASFTAEIQAWAPLVEGIGAGYPHDLVDGHWLRDELLLQEGPAMSNALEMLRNAEIYGEVGTPQEARRFLLRQYHNRD